MSFLDRIIVLILPFRSGDEVKYYSGSERGTKERERSKEKPKVIKGERET